MSSGCVGCVATDATALSVGGAFRAASSWLAKLPAEGALSSGGGRPHRLDRPDAVEELDAVFDEKGGVCWGDLDHQGCGKLGDAVPRKEGAGAADGDASG